MCSSSIMSEKPSAELTTLFVATLQSRASNLIQVYNRLRAPIQGSTGAEMRSHAERTGNKRSKHHLLMAPAVALAVTLLLGLVAPVRAQSAGGQAPTTPAAQPAIPQWQIDAGRKMEFDVASVKQDTAAVSRSTVNSDVPFGSSGSVLSDRSLLSATELAAVSIHRFCL